jgi:hypothetical protein
MMNGYTPKYFKDDGTEVNPDLIPKPDLCISCRKDGIGGEEDILCILNRMDQQEKPDFKCYVYEPEHSHRKD